MCSLLHVENSRANKFTSKKTSVFHAIYQQERNYGSTEALKGHRVVWKIEICYLIRMTYEWKPMSSG